MSCHTPCRSLARGTHADACPPLRALPHRWSSRPRSLDTCIACSVWLPCFESASAEPLQFGQSRLQLQVGQREGRGWGFGWRVADEATYPDTGILVGRWLGTGKAWVCRLATRKQGIVGIRQLPSWTGRRGVRGSCWLLQTRTSEGRRGRAMGSNVDSCTLAALHLLVE